MIWCLHVSLKGCAIIYNFLYLVLPIIIKMINYSCKKLGTKELFMKCFFGKNQWPLVVLLVCFRFKSNCHTREKPFVFNGLGIIVVYEEVRLSSHQHSILLKRKITFDWRNLIFFGVDLISLRKFSD